MTVKNFNLALVRYPTTVRKIARFTEKLNQKSTKLNNNLASSMSITCVRSHVPNSVSLYKCNTFVFFILRLFLYVPFCI